MVLLLWKFAFQMTIPKSGLEIDAASFGCSISTSPKKNLHKILVVGSKIYKESYSKILYYQSEWVSGEAILNIPFVFGSLSQAPSAKVSSSRTGARACSEPIVWWHLIGLQTVSNSKQEVNKKSIDRFFTLFGYLAAFVQKESFCTNQVH